MARQKGSILIEGTIGGIIYYKTKDGYFARSKGGIAKERIANDPNFAKTRETGSEFGYASRVGRLLREGVRVGCPGAEVTGTHYRLSAQLMNLVQQDTRNGRGQRRLQADIFPMLRDFSWNEAVNLDALKSSIEWQIAPATGQVRGTSANFIPSRDLQLPEGATHASISLVTVRIDDVEGVQVNNSSRTGKLRLDSTMPAPVLLRCNWPESEGKLLVIGIGISAFREENGVMKPLKEASGFVVTQAGKFTE